MSVLTELVKRAAAAARGTRTRTCHLPIELSRIVLKAVSLKRRESTSRDAHVEETSCFFLLVCRFFGLKSGRTRVVRRLAPKLSDGSSLDNLRSTWLPTQLVRTLYGARLRLPQHVSLPTICLDIRCLIRVSPERKSH